MSDLQNHRVGFHDGWAHESRKRNQGPVYLRAYRRGTEARIRFDNGGEDMPAMTARRTR
jgi:hypothetical protein